MPRAKLKVKIPGGPAALSAQHPDDEFRILASHPTEDGLLAILEIRTSDTEALVRELAEASWLTSYELLHADEQTLLVQYSLPFIPPPYRALLASENLPRFPLTIRNGWVLSDITTSHERLSQLKDELDTTGLTYEIMSVTQSTDPTALLTDRQRRFVTGPSTADTTTLPASVHSPLSPRNSISANRPRVSCSITPKSRLSRSSSRNLPSRCPDHTRRCSCEWLRFMRSLFRLLLSIEK